MNIIALCTDHPHQLYLVTELDRRFGLTGVVLERNKAQIRRLWQRRCYRTWIYRRYHAIRCVLTGRSSYRQEYFLSQIPSVKEWPEMTLEVDWINGNASREAIARWRPEITIVCGTGIIAPTTLSKTGITINIHGGCLPEYRGNHCIFFAFYERRFDQIGGTLHLVTSELDGGPILAVVRPPIYPHDNDETLYCRAIYATMARLFELIQDLNDGRQLSSDPQLVSGRVFRHQDRKPYLDVALWFRRRLGLHPVPFIRQSG